MEPGKFGRIGRSRGLRGRNFSGQGGRQIWEVSEVGKFLGQGGRKIFRGQVGRQIWEVWKDWEGGRILSPVINGLLQLHVGCASYHSSDYRTERLVHCITVLHVVQIHINICIYYSVVNHVRILDKNLSGARTQLL
jgi:hypothetical protein